MVIEWTTLVLLCFVAFGAGFVDAVVGGGGLIQTPAALVALPAYSVSTVIGSLKIPSFSGTLFAARQYLRKVVLDWQLLGLSCTIAFFCSFAGSQLLTLVSNDFMKPVLLVVLVAVAVYTYTKKSFGQEARPRKRYLYAYTAAISGLVGFYDGFIGPGTGSFLILLFISVLGFDFLRASAYAKMVNLATNLGSITLFMAKGKIIWPLALPMACANALGGMLGARLALARGNRFIRIFFLFVVTATLLRFAWDILNNHR
ncbi:MAG TPA: TSUP family transporter [Chitinophagaceae bacterium]|jgi:hypothetical protein|nr:TSUP family transporter [Chitinophagaceae bacterium]